MHVEHSVEVVADAARIFEVMTDIERWPEWTPSMRSVRRLDAGEFRVGSAARVEQPKLPASIWRVTSLTPRGFVWESRGPGLRMVATHEIEPGQGSCTVRLTAHSSGFLSPLLDLLFGRLGGQYVATEAAGLKRRCEQSRSASEAQP